MGEMKYADVFAVSDSFAVKRIKNRPDTVFKSKGIDGAFSAVKLLFKSFVTEIALGYSDRLDVQLFADSRIKISGNNRGLYIVNGGCVKARLFLPPPILPYYDDIMECNIDKSFTGARPGFLFNNSNDKNKAPENFDEFYDWTVESFFMLNFASEFFDIVSIREGMKYHLAIENGKISNYERADTEEASGTTVEFKLSNAVFGDIEITAKMLGPMIKYAVEKYPFAEF